jgi:predicted DNA-binding transcriptional regulator YafY
MSVNSEAIIGRHARAIRIMTCLQAGPAFNTKELAERMSVSRRTIYRDLNLIRAAGIGVEFDSQYAGYKVIQPARGALPPPVFSDTDLVKLALTAHFSLLAGFSDMAVSVRESLARLLAHYPSRMRESVWRLLNCCTVELPRPAYHAKTLEVVETLLSAVSIRKQVRVQLPSELQPDSLISTLLAPYRVVAGMQDWSVVGRSSYHRRTVRIETANIAHIETTDEDYRMPSGFRSRRLEKVG